MSVITMPEAQRRRLTGLRRLWILGLDTAARAPYDVPRPRPATLWQTLRSREAVKLTKFWAAYHLLVLPGIQRWLTRRLIRFDDLPFRAENVHLVGAGLGQNVFAFDSPAGRMVVKIDRESQGLSWAGLMNEARRVAEEHERVRAWYADLPGFIPREEFCIVNSPLQGRPALATIQPYVGDPIQGLFEDFDEESLARFLMQHGDLRRDYVQFATRLLEIYHTSGECIDLLGNRNLCVRGSSAPYLYFADPHDIYGPGRLLRYPDRDTKMAQRVGYLERILRAIETAGKG